MARSHIVLTALVAGCVATSSPAQDEEPMRDALVLPRVGEGGRRPFPTDAVLARVAAGTWTAPSAGDTVAGPDGVDHAWVAATANDEGWFRGPELRGGYVHWTVEASAPRVAMLHASGHAAVRVNDAWRPGDPYGNEWVEIPVALRAGRNELLFNVSRGRVRAKLVPPEGEVFFQLHDRTMPDLVHGEPWAQQGGILIANASARTLGDLAIRAGGAGLPLHETLVPRIEPMTVRKVPFWFGGAVAPGVRRADLRLELVRRRDGVMHVVDDAGFDVRVREPGQTHKRTFISDIDGSVQYYGVTPMADRDPDDPTPPALFLTLHGAGVEGIGQARVYQRKKEGWVVAPTNRRPFGFDWEDWGRLDAIEVLELNQRRLGIDPRRTYLTGHSMGGHGTWHVGVTFPGRFAAIGPSAGWRSFTSYTGAERFDDASPVERILALAANPSDTVALARNTLHYGVYILHGEKDDNVPADQARFMYGHLGGFHPDVQYHEEPGAGHWWGDRCCDWGPMFDFFRARERPQMRPGVEFHTANPGVSATSEWVTIEQQAAPLDFSSVEARFETSGDAGDGTDHDRLVVATANVARFAVDLEGRAIAPTLNIEIDGTRQPAVVTDGLARVAFRRTDPAAAWERATGDLPAGEKGPRRYGPFKDAFRHRVVFVFGTRGTDAENAWAAAKARFDAETFWYRGNGSVDVIPDTAFDPGAEPDRGVILYGNADTNAAWSALLATSPVQIDRGGVTVGDRRIAGADLAALFIRPRPGSPVACVGVVAGSGVSGAALTDRLPYFVSGVAYPDVVVFGPGALLDGVGGVRVVGIFGLDWSVEGGDFAWKDGQGG